MDFREIRLEGADWMQLVQDRDHWRAVVNTRMNFLVPCKEGNFLLDKWQIASQEELFHGISQSVLMIVQVFFR
jgi:hypothetical protein